MLAQPVHALDRRGAVVHHHGIDVVAHGHCDSCVISMRCQSMHIHQLATNARKVTRECADGVQKALLLTVAATVVAGGTDLGC